MDIQDLKIFVRTAAAKNFSTVAFELGLTPGTISKRIQTLEAELGVRLFHRTTRSIRITDEGAELLSRAEPILANLEEVTASLRDRTKHPSGLLRIAVPASLGRALLTKIFAGFMSAYQDIALQVDVSDRALSLQEGGYDVAVRSGTLADSELIARRLAHDPHVVVAAPSYLEQFGPPEVPNDLLNHDCFGFLEALPWVFARGAQAQTVRVSSRLRSSDVELLREAALAGCGILYCSEFHVAPDLAEGRLVRVLPNFNVVTNSAVWVVYPGRKHVLPKVRVFLDYLAQYFGDEQPQQGAGSRSLKRADGNVTPLRARQGKS